MILLIDIGNTRVKAAIFLPEQESWLDLPAASHLLETFDPRQVWQCWFEHLPDKSVIKTIGIASVNEGVLAQLKQNQPQWAQTHHVLAESQSQFLQLKSSYAKPQNMGVDRWLAMIAASNAGHQAALVVDAGTALTLDWINNDGHHIGGYILPGLNKQLIALLEGTERVFAGRLEEAQSVLPGNDTPECVLHGILAQATSFIISQAQQALNQGIDRLVMTGGESNLLISHLEQPLKTLGVELELRPRLVFEGLLAITRHEAKKS